jgi:AcrR family transcriptional regulator
VSTVRTGPQRSTEDALLDAALAHLRERGVDGLTVRAVAERAGVTHTTGYAYFSSLDHLVAAVFLRQVRAMPDESADPGAPVADRVAAALGPPSRAAADDPALARAGQRALFADEPAVAHLRDELGAHLVDRIRAALGPAADPVVVDQLLTAYSGAMLQASLGYLPFAAVPERLAALADRLA